MILFSRIKHFLLIFFPLLAFSCDANQSSDSPQEYVEKAEKTLKDLTKKVSHATWVQENFITHDTNILASDANELMTSALVDLANGTRQYSVSGLDYDTARKLDRLKLSLTLPAPANPSKIAELATLSTELNSLYSTGKYCPTPDQCMTLTDISDRMTVSRDPVELLNLWTGWHAVSPPMKPKFERLIAISNEGARSFGYPDLGNFWRSKYEVPAQAFEADVNRLWNEVKPFYEALHCHVRAKLSEFYGSEIVPTKGPIPAHLLGNMWAQSWGNIYDLVAPQNADPGYDLTAILKEKGMSEIQMVENAERFFTSLGFDPLPKTFWERSLFKKPADREVVCHASAWSIDNEDDIRIKMCIQKTEDDFITIHHELGHNFYQRAYKDLPFLYQEGANDAFHEAIGDTIALSVTPEYLAQIDLLKNIPDASKDIGLLMKMALDKIAFLPFGLLLDQWRWKVFNGEIKPENYNSSWWQMREAYQGVKEPTPRNEASFDPGAKYHVANFVPYTRYFLAHIMQFQFHQSLCEQAGYQGPLHRCSIYNNQKAGAAFKQMLEMGASRPWPETLKTLTGKSTVDATAITAYFAPLKAWLDEQNKGRVCGW